MNKFLTDEERLANPDINITFRRVKFDEFMGKIDNLAKEGKNAEEIINILLGPGANENYKKIIAKQDIYDYFEEHKPKEEVIQEEDNTKEEPVKEEPEEEPKEKESNVDLIKKMEEQDKELKEELKEEVIEEETTKETDEEEETDETHKYLSDEELEDYPDQPFKPYTEDQEEDMIQSIRINGIIQPIIVRPLDNGKYQILSGHNRRRCGKKAGLTKFPCKIKYGLTDGEAKLYMVDTNLVTRNKISPIERAKALLIKKNTYELDKIRDKIQQIVREDNLNEVNVRDKVKKTEQMSEGNVQRYLRLNYLNEDLQEMVDNGRISIKVGEQLSFLKKPIQQNLVKALKQNEKIKISESLSKKIRAKSIEENILTKDMIEDILLNKKEKEEIEEQEKTFKVSFLETELEKVINNLISNGKEVNIENIKEKILDLIDKLD